MSVAHSALRVVPSYRRPGLARRSGLALLLLTLVCGLTGCNGDTPAPSADIRALPSQPPAVPLQVYFPEIAKTHVALTYTFEPNTGVTDPVLLLPPTAESRWLLNYLGENQPAATADDESLALPIPMSRRAPIRADLLSMEMWLAHAESVYVSNYVAASRSGAKLRFSPWIEQLGLPVWKMGLPPVEPLQQPRLVTQDGLFLPTGSTLDLALRSPPGMVSFFAVVNESGQRVALTRDGRLYLSAHRRLTTFLGPLEGLNQAAIPEDAAHVACSAGGMVTGVTGADQKTPFSYGPVRIFQLPEAQADLLVEIDGFYILPATGLPDPVTPDLAPGLLQVGRREQTLWTPSWYYRNLRSISETRALVHSTLLRLDEALVRDQTTPPPVKVEVKPDIAPFQKIFQEWADTQSGARRRPPLRFRQAKRMILSRAFFAARKAPVRADGDDILLEFPPPDPATNRTPNEQIATLLADCARYLSTRMAVNADNLAHMYEIVETIQVGAEKKPRRDRSPHVVTIDENTGEYESLPTEKPFRTKLIPGNPNAIDAQGTVYFPNVNAADEIAEYKNLESEYKFILKALAIVQPELLLEDPQPLVVPAKPADWTE